MPDSTVRSDRHELDAQALVIVPFGTIEEAQAWAERIATTYPAEPRVVVTPGRESVWLDPTTGDAAYELEFEGGWRAKIADVHNGSVVIARRFSHATRASLSQGGTP